MADPKPALLMPLRLEIWHNNKDEVKIRWYPDDCHIFPDIEGRFDDSLERFMEQGYELKTFPPKISLYTFKDNKIELLAEGQKIYDDEGWAEIKNISEAYPQYIKYDEKDHLLEIKCGNISSDTKEEILKKAQASRDLFSKLFTEYEEKAIEKAKIKIVKREEYELIKTKVQEINITDLITLQNE